MKKVIAAVKSFVGGLDKILVLLTLCCTAISVVCLYSLHEVGQISSIRPFVIQSLSCVIGLTAAFIISVFDYKTLASLWKIYAPIAVLLVGLTYIFGKGGLEGADDKAWLDIGFTTFQPSELLKLAFIFTFSLHLMKVKDNINHIRPFLLLCLHGAVPVIMIVLQGDLGTALVFFAMFVFMIFAAGLSVKLIAIGAAAALVAAPLVWFFVLDDYLQRRFLVAQKPELYLDSAYNYAGVQQYRGRISIGSGGLFGRGMFSDSLYYVPVSESDFILSYIGQIFGFVGIVITLLLITALCVKILMTAKMSKDKLGNYICVGVFAMFFVQAVINVGMVFCVTPVIGITLPFISYGGSSSVVSYMAIGMALSVYRHNKKEMMFD